MIPHFLRGFVITVIGRIISFLYPIAAIAQPNYNQIGSSDPNPFHPTEEMVPIIEDNAIQYRVVQHQAAPILLEVLRNEENRESTAIILPHEIYTNKYSLRQNDRVAVIDRIGEKAFFISQLQQVSLPPSVRIICRQAFALSNLESISFSQNLVSIGEKAFERCYLLTEVNLPESLMYIDSGAFQECQLLEKVDLPSSLMALGGNVFLYCGSLAHIYSRAIIPPVANSTDFGVLNNTDYPMVDMITHPDFHECVLHVPEESIDLYRNAPGWNLFRNIVPIEETSEVKEYYLEERPSAIFHRIEGNTLIIPGFAGDTVSVYDVDGHILDSHTFSTDGEFRHQGSGVRIFSVGDKSVKTIL